MIEWRQGTLDPKLRKDVKKARRELEVLRITGRANGEHYGPWHDAFEDLVFNVAHWLLVAEMYVDGAPTRLPQSMSGAPTPEPTSQAHVEQLFRAAIDRVGAVRQMIASWADPHAGPSDLEKMHAAWEKIAERHERQIKKMKRWGYSNRRIALRLGLHAKAVALVPRPRAEGTVFMPSGPKAKRRAGKGVGAAAYREGKS